MANSPATQYTENARRTVPWGKLANKALMYIVLVLAALIFTIPLVWALITSLKINSEIGTIPIKFLPSVVIWKNYYDALTIFPFFEAAGRSTLLCLISAIPLVFTSSLVGYGFARLRAPGRDLLFVVVIATVMIPSLVNVFPMFIIYSRLHLIGTYWPWLIGALGGAPFFIFLFRQYFAGIPKELEEAAELDGCGRFGIYQRIFMPNATPVLAATFIFSFLGNWSDFISPNLYLSADQFTLAMKLASAYVDPKGNPLQAQTMAGIMLYIIPLLVLYMVGQKFIYQMNISAGLK